MRRSSLFIPALVAILAGGGPLRAQSLQTGALVGVIRDAQGKPLAGIHLRAKSGQIERTAVTNEQGEYRLPLLNAGVWTLLASSPGYQTSTAKVTIAINDRQTANFKMVALQNVIVEVTSDVTGIDIASVQTSTNLNADLISKLPGNLSTLNGLDALMAAVPGVQSAGDNHYYIGGGGHDQNLFTVDGNITNVTATNEAFRLVSIQPPREFMESVEVVTGGFGAEYNVMGGAINAVTKSGTNAWEGDAFWYTNFPNSAARGKWNADIPGMTPPPLLDKYHRYGGSVSGPLFKDKLFIFLGYQGFTDKVPAGSYTGGEGGANWNGLVSDATHVTGPNLVTLKVNWFPHTDHQVVLSASRTEQKSVTNHRYPEFGTRDMGATSQFVSQNLNLTWNWCISSELVLVSSVGQFKNPATWTPTSAAPGGGTLEISDYRYFTQGPGASAPNRPAMPEYLSYNTGMGGTSATSDNPNRQIRLDLSWSHQHHMVKAGYLQQDTEVESTRSAETDWNLWTPDTTRAFYDYPYLLERLKIDVYHQRLKGHLRSYYLKDVWEFLPGLRADVGFRYDPFTFEGGAAPYTGQTLARFSNFGRQVQPRLGLTWDVEKDGRTKVSAYWGRFMETLPMQSVSWASSTTSSYAYWFQEHYTYNADYAGGPFTIQQDPATGKPYEPDLVHRNGTLGHPSPRATDLRLPHKDMLQLGLEKTLPGGWSASATWKFWEMANVLEDSYFTNPDGSSAFTGMNDKVLWNPGPGTVTFLDQNDTLHTWNSPFPKPVDRYLSLDLHAAHFGDNHSLSLDYTWVHHYGNYRGSGNNFIASNAGNASAGGSANSTGEYDFYRTIATGNAESEPVHQVKLSGFYVLSILGQKLNIGPLITWQTGLGLSKAQPISYLYPNYMGSSYDPMQPTNQRVDMGRTPTTLLADLNLNMEIKVGRLSIHPTLSISNLFNARRPTMIVTNYRSGSFQDASLDPSFGKEVGWQEGRAVTSGVSLRF